MNLLVWEPSRVDTSSRWNRRSERGACSHRAEANTEVGATRLQAECNDRALQEHAGNISDNRSQGRLKVERFEGSVAAAAAPIGVASAPAAQLVAPRSARLVIIEEGASLRELEPPPDGCEHTIVVVQSRGELPSAFAQRVRRRLRSMREEQQGVVWVVFLLAPHCTVEVQAARVEIGRLLNHNAELLPTSTCVLALHAPAGAQWWVLELFDVLVLEHGCSALSAHIRFDLPRPRETRRLGPHGANAATAKRACANGAVSRAR